MSYLGDFAPAATVRIGFNTHKADGTPITLAGTPAVSVYKDASTTESTAGVSLSVDFDSRTGMHVVAIDTAADGTFYAAGSDFRVVITAGSVDSISAVGVVIGSFSLRARNLVGYLLAAAGLDAIAITDPGGVAGQTTFPKILVALYRRAFKHTTLTKTGTGTADLKTYGDDGTTVRTTQALADDGTTQSVGAAT